MSTRPLLTVLLLVPIAAFASAAAPSAVEGPATVCLKYSRFNLLPGERVSDFDAGVESMSIMLSRPAGDIAIAESEIWVTPQRLGKLVAQAGETRVYRARRRESFLYLVTGPTDFQPDARKLTLILSGPGFTGRSRDAAIYSRFRVGDVRNVQCDRRYLYGWEFFEAGDE